MATIEISQELGERWSHSDLVVLACTCESRSVSVFKNGDFTAKAVLALGSKSKRSHAYMDNLSFYKEGGIEVKEVYDAEIDEEIRAKIAEVNSLGCLNVTLDVSSFSRIRLACIIATLLETAEDTPVNIQLTYTLASFVSPPIELPVNKEVAPVHPRFSGLGSDPSLKLATVVGLGYEQNKALGAVEYLQANDAWLFIPTSPESKYLGAVLSSNEILLEMVPVAQRIRYPVLDPAYTFSLLESAVRGLTQQHKVALLPFGPKIFFALSLFVASTRDDVGVWYVSGEEEESPIDKVSSGFDSFSYIKIRA